MPSPERLIVVAGTGTEVGKTWWTCAVARWLRLDGVRVAARKPAQSFAPDDPPEVRDASLLAAATGEDVDDVCPPHRSYAVAMAPPMAAEALGLPRFCIDDLVDDLRWPVDIEIGFVETAGGIRSPLAIDGDNLALADALDPALVLLVADAGLGTINLARLSIDALDGHRVIVVLNRYNPADDLHQRNRTWLRRDGLELVDGVNDLAACLRADPSR